MDFGNSPSTDYQRAVAAQPQPVKKKMTPLRRTSVAAPVQRKTYSSGGSSGGYSSGGSSGGSSFRGSGSSGSYTPPGPPSINTYLGTDSAYQQAVSGGKRSMADFISDLTRRRGEATTQFNQTTSSMEHDRDQQLEDLRNEFASRGLIQSGLYGQEQGKFQQKFTEQQQALSQQQAALLADLLSQQTNYKREQDMALQSAKQEALLRRAQKYNIGA